MQLYCDCAAGASGDMFLGALCHLGVDFLPLQNALERAGIQCTVKTWQEHRAAGAGFRADVTWPSEQPLRHPHDIAEIFNRVDVCETVRTKALAILEALTLAEAYAHGIPPEEVHFHEVGAIDTVVDILGTVWALNELGVTSIHASPLPWFSGTIECEHGIIPLPAPATAFLLENKPLQNSWPSLAQSEMITPTGAALVHVLCENFHNSPQGKIIKMGTGYGSRPSPAGLRLWLMEENQEFEKEYICQLESHLDHLTGEEIGAAIHSLSLLPQVLDVLWLSGIGKKNRPLGLLRVLCLPQHAQEVEKAFYTHTHTLGIRHSLLERSMLERSSITHTHPAHDLAHNDEHIAHKKYILDGAAWLRPEADALMEKAQNNGVGMPALRIKKLSDAALNAPTKNSER